MASDGRPAAARASLSTLRGCFAADPPAYVGGGSSVGAVLDGVPLGDGVLDGGSSVGAVLDGGSSVGAVLDGGPPGGAVLDGGLVGDGVLDGGPLGGAVLGGGPLGGAVLGGWPVGDGVLDGVPLVEDVAPPDLWPGLAWRFPSMPLMIIKKMRAATPKAVTTAAAAGHT
jgi:hypothetical protein